MLSNQMLVLLGLLFFAVANPMTFDFVDRFVNVKGDECPTQLGMLLHTVVFLLLAVFLEKSAKMIPLPKLA